MNDDRAKVRKAAEASATIARRWSHGRRTSVTIEARFKEAQE
jgi:hypothetical protein